MSDEPHTIGELLSRWIGGAETRASSDPVAALAVRWCARQGIDLRQARLRDGTLQLYVTSAAAATELRFRAAELRLALAEDPLRPTPDLNIKIHPA